MKQNSSSKTYHLSNQTCKQIALLAEESGESATAIVELAVNYFFRRDTLPEQTVLAKLTALEVKLHQMDQREETFFSLSRFILPYFIAALPDMLETKESSMLINSKGRKNLEQLEDLFQKLMAKTRPSFMESIFANLRTHLEENNQAKQAN